MGYRAHVCTRYEVHYGPGDLGYCDEQLAAFLRSYRYGKYGIVLWTSSDDTALELDPVGLEKLVGDLRGGKLDASVRTHFGDRADATDLERIFGGWLRDYDKENGFIRIEWF